MHHTDILNVKSSAFTAALALSILLVTVSAAHAQTQAADTDRVTTSVDWSVGIARVTIDRATARIGASGPAAISRTQRSIERDAIDLLVPEIAAIRYDSSATVGDLARNGNTVTPIERAAAAATPVDSGSTPDLRIATLTFALDLFSDLAARLVEHSVAAPIESRLGWVPHDEYTGILIYAADELPLFGTNRSVLAEPCLLPGLYYVRGAQQLLYRISEARNVDPDAIVRWGAAAYTADVQATGLADRLGTNPLRILAVGVFGSAPTDIVISESDALQIISSESNRALVRDGRVVIILSPQRL